jgi:dTMP kinase
MDTNALPLSVSTARFISFEGMDGAGKTTHIQHVRAHLESLGYSCVLTREPGGTGVGERIRDVVLHQPMAAKTQLLLMYAARYQHVCECIVPALQCGHWVLCDRFEDSSFAYQASAAGLGFAECSALSAWVLRGFAPALTLLFDLPAELAQERMQARSLATQVAPAPDEFERQTLAYMHHVRQGFLQRAQAEPKRVCVVDASQTETQVAQEVLHHLHHYLAALPPIQG